MPIAVIIESTWQATAMAPWAARLARGRGDREVLFLATSAAKGKKTADARKAAAKAAKKKPVAEAAREAVTEAAAAVREAVEAAADDRPAEEREKAAADREPETPLEAAVREAVEKAGYGGTRSLAPSIESVEIAPGRRRPEPAPRAWRTLLEALDDARHRPRAARSIGERPPRRPAERPPLQVGPLRRGRAAQPAGAERRGRGPSPAPPTSVAACSCPPRAGRTPGWRCAWRPGWSGPRRDGPPDGVEGVDALYVQKDLGPESRGLAQRKLRAAVRRALGGPLGIANGAEAGDRGDRPRRPLLRQGARRRGGSRGGTGLVMVGRGRPRAGQPGALRGPARRAAARDAGENERGVTVAVVRDAEAFSRDRRPHGPRGFVSPGGSRSSTAKAASRWWNAIEGPSQWSIDFVALMVLSTSIATFGEMQDSTAVVIGAMLVAPLMTPLVGCGLAVVQGNNRLVRGSVRSVALGFLVAFAVALGMGLLIPFPGLTSEVLARGRPTLLDLGVALVSRASRRPTPSPARTSRAPCRAWRSPPRWSRRSRRRASPSRRATGSRGRRRGPALLRERAWRSSWGAAIALLAVGVEGQHEHKSGRGLAAARLRVPGHRLRCCWRCR